MTSTKTIEIIVTPQGKTSIQTRGFAGDSCREASRFLEEALGQHSGERLTGEFHQQQSAGQCEQQRLG
jgi:hypothetical protein